MVVFDGALTCFRPNPSGRSDDSVFQPSHVVLIDVGVFDSTGNDAQPFAPGKSSAAAIIDFLWAFTQWFALQFDDNCVNCLGLRASVERVSSTRARTELKL